MKLTNTQDFVLMENFSTHVRFFPECYIKHAKFLKRQVRIQDIIPCDVAGNILDQLQFCCNSSDCGCMGMPINVNNEREIYDYYDAVDKVLFSNVEKYSVPNGKDIYRINGIPVLIPDENGKYNLSHGLNLIENLIPLEVELTQYGQKQFM